MILLLPPLQSGEESAVGLLSSMLLLPGDFVPANRTQAHNSCVHRAMDSTEVKVSRKCLGGVHARVWVSLNDSFGNDGVCVYVCMCVCFR